LDEFVCLSMKEFGYEKMEGELLEMEPNTQRQLTTVGSNDN